MLRRGKGSALIVALMVVLIISITAAGLIFVATQQRRMVAGETAQTRLFYAAESGMAIAIKRLRVMTMDQFINPTADDKVLVSNIPDVEINGCTVDLTSTWNSADDYWTLTAVATDENSKKTCTVTLDKIQCQAFTDNSVTISEDMPRSVQFVGVDPNGTAYQANDMLLGNLFFGGMINILRDPVFEGVVKSSSPKKSIRSIADIYAEDANTNTDATGLTDMQRLMASSKYANGIWDMSKLTESADNMKTRYSKVFPDGYTGNSGTIDKTKDVVATFDDVKNSATRPSAVKNPYIVTVGANDNVNVKIEKDYITVTPIPAGWESTNGKKPFNANNNTILFDGDRTENNRIAIQESVISGNLTVMSKNVDIEVLGDIKYEELVGPYNSAVSGYTNREYQWANCSVNGVRTGNNIENLAKTLQTNNVQSMFGCVSEAGNIWLGKELCADMRDIMNVTVLSGVFYAPNGKFGIREATDNGAAKYGTINTAGTVTDQNGWYEGSGGSVLTRIVVVGSAMMKSVGKFRQIPSDIVIPATQEWQSCEQYANGAVYIEGTSRPKKYHRLVDIPAVYATDTRGFEGAFCNDYRFSEDGMFPALFKPVKDSNGWWFNTDNAVWSYSYGVCSN